jgi:hypothetical protein
MSALKRSLYAGIAGLTMALPLGYAAFDSLADVICAPGDCYGEPAWIPLVAGLLVATTIAGIGLSFTDSFILAYARERVFGRIGWAFGAGAIPVGALTTWVVAGRYCESGCSGDYMTMGLAAVGAGAAVAAISLGLSVSAFILAHRPTPTRRRSRPSVATRPPRHPV